jgi:hypothetical protein
MAERGFVGAHSRRKWRRPSGELVPGPTVRFIGRRHGRRADRRWAKSWSPEQISNRLRVEFPDDESMRISHEDIYQALHVQGAAADPPTWCVEPGVLLIGASTWGGGTEGAIVGWLAQRYDRVVAGQQHDRVSGTYSLKFAVCLDGANACPPEDVGGSWAYEHLLAVLADPSHEEHRHLSEWVGGPIDPCRVRSSAGERSAADGSLISRSLGPHDEGWLGPYDHMKSTSSSRSSGSRSAACRARR